MKNDNALKRWFKKLLKVKESYLNAPEGLPGHPERGVNAYKGSLALFSAQEKAEIRKLGGWARKQLVKATKLKHYQARHAKKSGGTNEVQV